jgi:hypothetical protein
MQEEFAKKSFVDWRSTQDSECADSDGSLQKFFLFLTNVTQRQLPHDGEARADLDSGAFAAALSERCCILI